jgi:hypothetical protein
MQILVQIPAQTSDKTRSGKIEDEIGTHLYRYWCFTEKRKRGMRKKMGG